MSNESENVVIEQEGTISGAFDRIFHFTERGSSLGSEIGAGLSTMLIGVCALVMNTAIVAAAYGNVAGPYLAASVLCLVGTLLLGILTNLPLTITANMGLSAMMINMLGANSGLTYANLLAITFVAALAYLVVVLTPARKLLADALPEGVKKALPVGTGLYVAIAAAKNAGLINASGFVAKASELTKLNTYYLWLMAAAVVAFILFKAMGKQGSARKTLGLLVGCMWVGGIVFFMDQFMGGQTAAVIVYERLNLVFATDGASPYNIGAGLEGLKMGELFVSGFDFSGFTGNAVLLFVQGVLTFLFMGLYTNLGAVKAAAVVGGYDTEDYAEVSEGKALFAGAVMSVAAPLMGAAPVAIGTESAVGTNDGGKTGLTSVAAAVGFAIAIFSWIFIMFLATGTHGVGMWIEATETKLNAYVQDTFVFCDLVMMLVGACMLVGIRRVNAADSSELIPFLAVVIGAGVLGNIAFGAAVGCVAYLIVRLAGKNRKETGIGTVITGVVMLAFLIISLI